MKKYELKFRIGDIFKVDDDLSYIILRLFAIFNDLRIGENLLLYEVRKDEEKGKLKADVDRGELTNIFRLMASHLKEALDVLEKANKNKEFLKLKKNIPDIAKKVLNKKFPYGNIKLGSLKKNILEPIRNNFFHPIKDLDKGLIEKKDLNSEISFGDIKGDFYFGVVDEIIFKHLVSVIGDTERSIRDILPQFSELTNNILEFILQIFKEFSCFYMGGKYKIIKKNHFKKKA